MARESEVQDFVDRINAEVAASGIELQLVELNGVRVKLAVRSMCGGCEHEARPLLVEVRKAFSHVFGSGLNVSFA